MSSRYESWGATQAHREKVRIKFEELEGKRALYKEWERHLPEHDPYMRELQQRITKLIQQLTAMGA